MPTVFVYGALMARPLVLDKGRLGVVRGFAARFVAPGLPLFEPRFLALVEAPGEQTPGVVFDIDDAAWARMSRHEFSYERRTVTAQVDGEELEALALVLSPDRAGPPGRPSARYARILVHGAEAHGLPDDLVAHYRSLAETGSKASLALVPLRGPIVWLGHYIGPRVAAGVVLGALVLAAVSVVRLLVSI